MLKHYLLLSLKVLRRRPFFTFISIVGISLTLLVLMVTTALMDHSWAPMAPESRQSRILLSETAMAFGSRPDGGISAWCCRAGLGLYEKYARTLPGIEYLSVFKDTRQVDSYVDGRKIRSQLRRVDGEYWKILDFTFVEGRPFTADDVARAEPLAVLNRTTRDRFFGAAAAVGRTIEADGERLRVVGVVEDVSFLRSIPFAEIWAPYTTAKVREDHTALMGDFQAMVLAAPDAELNEIRSEFNARLARIPQADFPYPFLTTLIAPFETKFNSFARHAPVSDKTDPEPQGWLVIAAGGALALVFLLLPIINLVNINLSRIMERSSEIGVRKAFGASSRSLVGQFIVENVVLTLAGALLGLVLSAAVLAALNRSGVIPYAELALNIRIFLYGLLIAGAFGVLSGVYPAWRMSRLHPAEALRGGRR
ncbi:MAG: ABC transporter permease [Vicinamibacterales bacterium]